MERDYTESEIFDGINFSDIQFKRGEYEACTFNNCDFTEVNMMDSLFIDCEFNTCNLTMTNLSNVTFRDVKFVGCKMLGLRFYDCNEFGVMFSFDGCTLTHASFYKLQLKKLHFKNSSLEEVDLTDCDLTETVFDNCDFKGARFEHTTLVKADLTTSYNYSIDPELNNIKKAKFSLAGISGLLDKYDIDIRH